MTYQGPKVKLSRRFGVALTPKAAKIMEKRTLPPGQHGRVRSSKDESDFKKQLIQKQLLRAQYNILEAQMRRYYQLALQSRENRAERLIQLLESRLDALVLRAGFAPTIYAARQYVTHRHFTVNGKAVDIPSYMVQPGDVVAVRAKSRKLTIFCEWSPKGVPAYLEITPQEACFVLARQPQAIEIPIICELSRVIEFYSR
ncbi:MAG: 30S ribosomal protein S4 [Anaerolineales bacterium]|nr:30S ribosomal protein S4 [Anaerolineales bacterium]MCZ2122277.1 30S ribosomal protein S4 [Anaerolineales bacterium]